MDKSINKNVKIGLALGSGTARGLAHIGVLKVLERENIKIDYIAGSSMGAIVGGVYACGKPVAEMESLALDFTIKKAIKIANPSFSKSGIFDGKNIEKIIKKIIGDATFADTIIPLNVVCADICSGDEVVIDSGLIRKALRASSTFPGVFVPAHYNNRYLVDGGLVNPVPANLVRKMGADIVIAVDVTRTAKKYTEFMRRKKESLDDNNMVGNQYLSLNKEKSLNPFPALSIFRTAKNKQWVPNMVDIFLQTVYIAEEKIASSQLRNTQIDLLLSPELGHISMFEFNRTPEIIRQGEVAAYEAMPVLKNLLNSFETAGIL